MKKPHILDSAADWATWYRILSEDQAGAIREVLALDIELPLPILQRLSSLVPTETECAQCGTVSLCCDDGEAYVCVDEDECHERQKSRMDSGGD